MRPARVARTGVVVALAIAAGAAQADPAGFQTSYIPGRPGVRGTVPNPGTQPQELTNLTLPAPYNVFELTVTCAGCHGQTIDQGVGHFGVQSGTAMASAARDPVFRANQIAANNILRAVSGEDGAGNMCFRCHSPNGWYSGRFDPTLGGDAEARTMLHSTVLSTDDEGISCEMCHRAVGGVAYKRPDLDPAAKVWNLLAGIGGYAADPGWSHDGHAFVDPAGDPTIHPGSPFGDTTLQFSDGLLQNGPYPGTVAPSFTDVPQPAWGATDYNGQIYAVYPAGDPRQGQPVVNPDGSIAPTYDQPISAPIDWAKSDFTVVPPKIVYDYQAQSMALEHPTAESRFLKSSEMCGACHDLTVPVLNHGMPEQRTYTEWKFSAFSKPGASTTLGVPVATERTVAGEVRCQDCHMPKVRFEFADDAPAAPSADPTAAGWDPFGKDRNPTGGPSKHTHAGANRDLAAMMKFLYPEVDLEVLGAPTGTDVRAFPGVLSTRNPAYDRNIRATEISMADAVKVEILSGPAVTATPGVYEVQVKVTNRTGHRIPTGYPDGRRMWVSLDVKDASGASAYRSGVYDAADARLYTDASAKTFSRAQTNLITSGAQPAGNALQARANPSDSATAVLVVSPSTLPSGTLTSFETFVAPGSEGRSFEAYLLRPTGVAGAYGVVFASGALTVPATPGVVASYPVAGGVATQAGDRIAHRGQGVPFDMSAGGVDAVYYPITGTPAQGAAIALGGAAYPAFDPAAYGQQPRTYSFGATVVGANAVMVYERVTCRDGLVPGAPLYDGAPDGICEDAGTPSLLNNRIMFDNRIPPAGFTYADYRTAGAKFWSHGWAPNPNAGGALRPVPCEDAPGNATPASGFGGSCAATTAPRYPDGQGFDVVTYRFASATPPVSARAEIGWQTHTREYMEYLRDQQENLGLVDAVRPEGPLDPLAVGYPLTPSYLSDVIQLATIADPYRPGVPLRDNWGGVAYAAWLKTGRGAPAVVASADTTVTAAPAAPAAPAVTPTQGVPFDATISWPIVPGAEGYLVSVLYGCPTRAQGAAGIVTTHCYDPAVDVDANGAPLPAVSTVGTTTQWDRLAIVKADACAGGTCGILNQAMNVAKTYGFKVAAFNAAGFGPESAVTTYRSPASIPFQADLLKLVAVTTMTATLAWTDTADNETIFAVQLVPVMAPQPPLSLTLTPNAAGTGVLPPPAPEQIFAFPTQTPGPTGFGGNNQTLTGLTPNTAYNVQVQACNATACSGVNLNGPIQIRTLMALIAPTLAAPTVSQNPLTVNLAWSAVTGAADYLVERTADGGATWTALPALAATTLADTGVLASTTYGYRVSARNGANVSPPSAVQTVTTPAPLATPGTPTASAPTATRRVTVAWTYATGQGQTGFRVERTKAGGAAVVVAANLAATARSYVDTLQALPATQGTSDVYTYTVTALQGAMTSLPSAPSNAVTLRPAPPTAPSNLVVTAGATAGTLRVQWTDRAQNELAFEVERMVRQRANLTTCTGAWSAFTITFLPPQPASPGVGAVATVIDGGLNSGACYQYQYKVRASNDGGVSAWVGPSALRSAP